MLVPTTATFVETLVQSGGLAVETLTVLSTTVQGGVTVTSAVLVTTTLASILTSTGTALTSKGDTTTTPESTIGHQATAAAESQVTQAAVPYGSAKALTVIGSTGSIAYATGTGW